MRYFQWVVVFASFQGYQIILFQFILNDPTKKNAYFMAGNALNFKP